jgi:hypothetical protein
MGLETLTDMTANHYVSVQEISWIAEWLLATGDETEYMDLCKVWGREFSPHITTSSALRGYNNCTECGRDTWWYPNRYQPKIARFPCRILDRNRLNSILRPETQSVELGALRRNFDPRQMQDIFVDCIASNRLFPHSMSCLVCSSHSLIGGKAAGAWSWYLDSPISLYGVVLNCLSTKKSLPC